MNRIGKPELNGRQAAFVRHYAEHGNGRAAVTAAGYQFSTKQRERSQAYRLLSDPKILDALRRESEARFRAGVPIATNVLLQLAESDKVPPETRLRAANSILDRGGMRLLPAETKHAHLHLHQGGLAELSDAELNAQIAARLRELPGDMLARLGFTKRAALPVTIDATAEHVPNEQAGGDALAVAGPSAAPDAAAGAASPLPNAVGGPQGDGGPVCDDAEGPAWAR